MEQYDNLQIFGHLLETGDDLVDDKQIRAFLPAPDIVEHRSPFSDDSHDIWDAVQVEKWKFVRRLGRGGFGQVHLEEKIFERFPQSQGSRPQLRAVKIIRESDGGSRTMHHLPEILGMAKFSKFGAFFIQLFAWFQIASEICIAMEWAPYGDLEDCVLKPLPEVEVQEIVRQISLAVVIMHERRFLHRDLNPKNVFVFRKQPDSPEWRVKLGDFGVSKRVRDAAITSWHTSIEADCSAPEVLGLLGGDYTEESSYAGPVDMWSLGYLAHWLLTKHYPLTKFVLPRYCRLMDPIPLSELESISVSNQAVDFMKNLLHLTPASRMTAQEAYSHPWLALPPKGSMPSSEHSIISYPLQQTRRSTSTMSNAVSGRYGMPQSAESQASGTSNPTFQTFEHRPLLPSSGDYRDFSQEAAPFLTNSDHQIEHPSGNNRSAQAPDLEETQAEVMPLMQEKLKVEMREPARAKIQEAVQHPREQREDRNAHIELEKQQHGRKVLQPNSEDEQEEKEPDPAVVYKGKTMNIVQPIAESRKKTDIQPMSNDEIDSAAIEKELEALEAEAEEDLRKERYMKKNAVTKQAIRKREEEWTAANDAKLREAERRGEEEETRHEEGREYGAEGTALEALQKFRDLVSSEKQTSIERRRARTQVQQAEKVRELQRFSKEFTLKTPPPKDLISLLARDPAKQEAIVDSYRKQSQDDAELLRQMELLYPHRQSENTKHLSESMSGSQQKNVEPHPKNSWAKIVASGVEVQQPAKKASTVNQDATLNPTTTSQHPSPLLNLSIPPFKKQKRRRKKRGANGG